METNNQSDNQKEHEKKHLNCCEEVTPPRSMLIITDLPVELIVLVLDYIPLCDKYNASMSCHLLYEAFNHPLLWRTQEFMVTAAQTTFDFCMARISPNAPNILTFGFSLKL